MSHIRLLAETIFNFAQETHDYDQLSRLSEMAWSLRPLIEADGSEVEHQVGELLWYYIGLQRDAPSSMAQKYANRVAKHLKEKETP